MTREAKILSLKPGAGKLWWETYLNSRWDDVERRFQEAGSVYWHPASAMPLELFAYVREAQLCFSLGRFLATISLMGALVEITLNRDPRLTNRSDLRRIGGWITLNNNNLGVAESQGLPVSELLDPGETVTASEPVRFVRSRNKIAHGDVAIYAADLPEQNASWEKEAHDQLSKGQRFLVAWFNSDVAI